MNKGRLMTFNCAARATAITVVVLGLSVAACVKNSSPIPEAQYPTQIVGRWQGTVGDSKETMSIAADRTFICQMYPMGFIGNTLSQGVAGTIRGTWKIIGAVINLRITGAEHEP